MGSRLELQRELEDLLQIPVYYQPPESIRMTYPCLVYNDGGLNIDRADNLAYKIIKKYDVTIIDRHAENDYSLTMIRHFPNCTKTNHTRADGLHHDHLTLYY